MAERDEKGKFLPGSSGNEGNFGGSGLTRRFGRACVAEKFDKFLKLSISQLDVIARDPETITMDVMIIAFIGKAIKTSDPELLNFIFIAVMGNITKNFDPDSIGDKLNKVRNAVIILPSNGKEAAPID